MKFIDLFCGLGGFHIALKGLGHKCVFASEIEKHLIENYKKNFNLKPHGDIRKLKIKDIPKHDILCAGFPCQPFSKAGKQSGFSHKVAGNMFYYILKILKIKRPKYLILENVPNLYWHNGGKTWKMMHKKLEYLGYKIQNKILSPINFGIPQTRDRFYIIGKLGSLKKFIWPKKQNKKINLQDYIINKPLKPKNLTEERVNILEIWNSLLKKFPKKSNIYNPIWTMEFGADYPLVNNLKMLPSNKLGKYRGRFGETLKNKSKNDQLDLLPSYAKRPDGFPDWKKKIIIKNREFYKRNIKWCKMVIKNLKKLHYEAYFKLEWNCMNDKIRLDDKLISFRPSGIRVRRALASPTLVSTTVTQLPILFKKKRYLSFEECLFLQGFPKNFEMPQSFEKFYFSIGNAVNVKVVKEIAKKLFN